MIHLSAIGRPIAVCEDPAAVLLTDDRRRVTCRACLEQVPDRLVRAAAAAYARFKLRAIRPLPTGVLDIGR